MVHLKPVTKENLDTVLDIKMNENQMNFVSSTAESMAQAYVYFETSYPFAVYHGNDIVGFIMMGYYEEKKYYTLWKLLIDEKHQNKGYGKKALELGIRFLKEKFYASSVYTGVFPENKVAKRLYLSVGFKETGLFENGMEELCLII